MRFSKPRPHRLVKQDAARQKDAADRRERRRCNARSGGRCEVWVWVFAPELGRHKILVRCPRRAHHNHHLKSGLGVRNRGDSIMADARLDVCERCHQDIHGHVLTPVNDADRYAAVTVTFERVE